MEMRGKGCRRGMEAILHDYNKKSGWNGNRTEMKENKENEDKKISEKEIEEVVRRSKRKKAERQDGIPR